MLNSLVCLRDDSIIADGKTVAECTTSECCACNGDLRVSLRLASPPESSFLCYGWTGRRPELGPAEFRVIAAHGDSVLVDVRWDSSRFTCDSCVYSAGGATRPPALTQLPARDVFTEEERRGYWGGRRRLCQQNTGLLRRGEDELLVAQLELTRGRDGDMAAQLCVLHVGRHEWEVRPVAPVVLDDEGCNEGDKVVDTMSYWNNRGHQVVPVGDRFLCWVDYSAGIVVWDTVEECRSIRYVRLPVGPPWWKCHTMDARDTQYSLFRNICCAGGGGAAVRFVTIDRRCCCGGHGTTTCPRSRSAFMVTTWTLTLRTDDEEPMAWVKDAVLDCEELWALLACEGLPRVQPCCPVLSMDNPGAVCFRVSDPDILEGNQVWMVEVDMRKKTLLSVVSCTGYVNDRGHHLPVKPHY